MHTWRNKGSLGPKDTVGGGRQHGKGTQQQSTWGAAGSLVWLVNVVHLAELQKERTDQTMKNFVFQAKAAMNGTALFGM